MITQHVRRVWLGAVASLLSGLVLLSPSARGADGIESFDAGQVVIQVQHGIELPWKKPGFRIEIAGWIPNESLSIHAISPTGEKLDLVPAGEALKADEQGSMTVDVDYERKGLRPGHWVFLVAGKAGAHIFQTDLPFVEPPTASNQSWRLTFGEAKGNKQ